MNHLFVGDGKIESENALLADKNFQQACANAIKPLSYVYSEDMQRTLMDVVTQLTMLTVSYLAKNLDNNPLYPPKHRCAVGVKDAMELLGCCRNTLKKLTKPDPVTGEIAIPSFKNSSGEIVLYTDDISNYLESHPKRASA